MEMLMACCIGILTTSGVFLLLRGRTFPVVLGLTLLSYAVNLFLFTSGGISADSAPILGTGKAYTDPLPQALVLTAIVIGFAMTAFVIILAMRARADLGNDHVDGRLPQDALDEMPKPDATRTTVSPEGRGVVKSPERHATKENPSL